MRSPPSLFQRALPALLPVASIVVLFGCGGNGGGGASSSASDADGRSVRAAVSSGAAGSQCTNGGLRIDSGLDSNGNGQLDASEVTQTQYVCNGAAGSSGLAALLRTSTEAPGVACAQGGIRIVVGVDSNANGVLDAGEETGTQYVCNGAPGVTWQVVSGATAQMVAGHGYFPDYASQPVELNLPTAPALGDIVQITGKGAGGWKVTQNAGQRINLTGLMGGWGTAWAGLVAVGAGKTGVATSADGCRVFASQGTSVMRSTDCGLTTTSVDTTQPVYDLVASGDGQVVLATYGDPAAVGASNFGVLLSRDGGATWTAPFAAAAYGTAAHYRLGAVSRSGTHLLVASGNSIQRSSDGGATWTATAAPGLTWRSVAIADNGQKLVAVAHNSAVWTSEDGGANWTSRTSSFAWRQVVMSPDGTRLVAAADSATIWTSSDGGIVWGSASPARAWTSVAMSDDGHYLLAGTAGSGVYGSRDGGQSWRALGTTTSVANVALSSEGRSLFVGGNLGAMQSLSDTRPGALGYLLATADETATLQYVGDGRFNLIDWTGLFLAR